MRSSAASRPLLPLLLVLFVGSGTAALIYEIVWLQLLQLVIGSSAVSVGVLLATFMGGMCLGSLALPRLISARHHPLRVYALLELGIGLMGIVVLFGMPYVSGLYVATVGHGLPGIPLRALVCAVCLLPPTVLMGATLPAMARWIETTPQGVAWLGFFYGGNIAGAVLGCLLAGFYLLRVHDMATATCFAAAINGAVALSGLALARVLPYGAPGDSFEDAAVRAPGSWPVYLTIALSGMGALGAEVVWTRLLSLMLGGTVYTFSLILAVFLAGLGIGSSAGSLLARGTLRPRVALGWCQMLLAAAIAWTAFMLARSLPYWPINPWLSTSPWLTFQLDLVRCIWAILPAACLWGASFPLALAAVAARERDPGRLVGAVYAANTLGAIVGALGSMFLIGSGPSRSGGVWSLLAHLCGHAALPVRGRGHERFDRRLPVGQRRPEFPRQRQGGSLDRAPRHAPATDAREHPGAAPPEPAIGAGRGIRSGRHRRLVRAACRRGANRHLRDRAVDPAGGGRVLRGAELPCARRSIATFLEVFPDATVWANEDDGRGYDIVLLGRTEAAPIDVDALQRRLDRADHRAVAASLRDVGLGSAVALLATYAGRGPDLAPWLKGAAINRDRNLRLQYLAGLGLNLYRSDPIYEEMLAYRRFPEELFVGSSGSRIILTPRPSGR